MLGVLQTDQMDDIAYSNRHGRTMGVYSPPVSDALSLHGRRKLAYAGHRVSGQRNAAQPPVQYAGECQGCSGAGAIHQSCAGSQGSAGQGIA
ncbi:hypothetical protein D1872_299760 [compost metagenome]